MTTTYTFQGIRRFDTSDGGESASLATLVATLPNDVTGLILQPVGTGTDGLPIYDIDFVSPRGIDELSIDTDLDGADVGDLSLELLYFEVTVGPYAGTILLDYFFPATGTDVFFQFAGPRVIDSVEEYRAFSQSIPDADDDAAAFTRTPVGAFAPGETIVLADLPSLVDVTDNAAPLEQPTSGDDGLSGSPLGDAIDALAGNDSVDGAGGNDTLAGGPGDDSLSGGTGADEIAGDDGADTLSGGQGPDTLTGGLGDDVLEGGPGADVMGGGAGTDTGSYAGATGPVTAALANPRAGQGEAQGDRYFSVENLAGGGANDDLRGDGGANVLSGGAGADLLFGLGGDDRLQGEAGNDRLFGQTGDDVLEGGAGRDILNGGAGADAFLGQAGRDMASYFGAEAGVTVALANAALNAGEAAGDTHVGIEDLLGTAFGDDLRANNANNLVFAQAGDDTVRGLGGNDVLLGGDGDDVLFGQAGGDRLIGGLGNDAMAGGTGADIFVFAEGDGRDVIRGFEDGVDRLDFGGAAVTIEQFGNATRIVYGTDDILFLTRVDASVITSEDLIPL